MTVATAFEVRCSSKEFAVALVVCYHLPRTACFEFVKKFKSHRDAGLLPTVLVTFADVCCVFDVSTSVVSISELRRLYVHSVQSKIAEKIAARIHWGSDIILYQRPIRAAIFSAIFDCTECT
jgi:hypothetical protein